METAIGAQFERHGIKRRDARFNIAIAEYMNNGGTLREATELLYAAFRKDDKGSHGSAGKAPPPLPESSPRMGNDGLGFRADKAASLLPSVPQPEAVKGRQESAGKAAPCLPNAAPKEAVGSARLADKALMAVPPASPKPMSDLARKAMVHVAQIAAKASITYKLADGRDIWSEVKAGELRTVANVGRRDAIIANLVRIEIEKNHPAGFDELMTPKELLIPESVVKQISDRVVGTWVNA